MAYETIKAGILEGKLISGENYSELDLAKSLGGREALRKKGRAKEVLGEHKAIVEAISQGDGEKTKEAIKTHMINGKLAALECRQ